MRDFQRKRGLRNILESWPVLTILGVVLLFCIYGIIGFTNKMAITSENKNIAENKLTQLQKQKDQLSGDITKLKTDKGVEADIREKFGLAKDGEGEIVVVDDKNGAAAVNAPSSGFFSFFTNLFK